MKHDDVAVGVKGWLFHLGSYEYQEEWRLAEIEYVYRTGDGRIDALTVRDLNDQTTTTLLPDETSAQHHDDDEDVTGFAVWRDFESAPCRVFVATEDKIWRSWALADTALKTSLLEALKCDGTKRPLRGTALNGA